MKHVTCWKQLPERKKDNNDVNEDDPRISVDRASIGNQALTITDLTYDDAGKTFWWKFNIDERIVNRIKIFFDNKTHYYENFPKLTPF